MPRGCRAISPISSSASPDARRLEEGDVEPTDIGPEEREVDEVGDQQVLNAGAVAGDLLAIEDLGELRRRARDLGLAVADRRARGADDLQVRLAYRGQSQFAVDSDLAESEILARGHQEGDQRLSVGVLGGARDYRDPAEPYEVRANRPPADLHGPQRTGLSHPSSVEG